MQNVVDRRIKCDGVDHTEHSFTKVSCAYRGSGQWLVKMAPQPISPITAEYTISNFVLSTRNQRSRARCNAAVLMLASSGSGVVKLSAGLHPLAPINALVKL